MNQQPSIPTPDPGWRPQVPPADEVSADYWAATGEHRFTVQTCGGCGHVQFPPRAVCIGCSSMDKLIQTVATGRGEVDAWTTVHRSPRPDAPVPYTLARVRLEEGPIVLTRLEPADGWAAGDRVQVAFHDLADGRALPYFYRATQDPTVTAADSLAPQHDPPHLEEVR